MPTQNKNAKKKESLSRVGMFELGRRNMLTLNVD